MIHESDFSPVAAGVPELSLEGMKLTRERKIYGALLGIGFAVLGADRLMGGPASAAAGTLPDQVSGTDAAPEVASDSARRVAIGERLAELAAASASQDAGRDAFRIDPVWRALIEPEMRESPTDEAESPGAVMPVPGAVLPKVTVIMQNSAGGCAVIDGVVVQVGATTSSGMKLVGLEQRAARLLVNGTEVLVPVVDPSAGGSR